MESSAQGALLLREPTPTTLSPLRALHSLGLGSSSSAHSTQTGDAEAPHRRKPGRPPRTKACQVCATLLTDLPAYHQRYRICVAHRDAASVLLKGVDSRFCQQCGAFHPVSKFNGARRSCRDRLRKHAIRRRKSTDGAEAPGQPASWQWEERQAGVSDADTPDQGPTPSKRRKAEAASNSTDASGNTAAPDGQQAVDQGASGGTADESTQAQALQSAVPPLTAITLAPCATQPAEAWPWQDYWPKPAPAVPCAVDQAPLKAEQAQQQAPLLHLAPQQQQAAPCSFASVPSVSIPKALAKYAVPSSNCCDPLAALLAAAAAEEMQDQQQQQQQQQLAQQLAQQRTVAAAAAAPAACAMPAVAPPALQSLLGSAELPTSVLAAATAALVAWQQQQQAQQQAQLLATLAGLPALPPAHLAVLVQALQQPGMLQALQGQSPSLAALLAPAAPTQLPCSGFHLSPVTPAAWQHANPGVRKEEPFAPAPGPSQPTVRLTLAAAPAQAQAQAQALPAISAVAAAAEVGAATANLAAAAFAVAPSGGRAWGGFPVTTGFT